MLTIVETYEGLGVAAHGVCGVCGWSGWDVWDVGLRVGRRPVDGGPLPCTYDADAECCCPRCGLHEVRVDLPDAGPSAA